MSPPAPTDFTQLLGALLQRQRQRQRLTQAELAERADLSLKYIGEVERGEANVTVHALGRIAAALGWDPWTLFASGVPPISQQIHTLLLAELTTGRDWLQRMIDWLSAFEPNRREAIGPLADDPAVAALLLGPRQRGRPPHEERGGPSCP